MLARLLGLRFAWCTGGVLFAAPERLGWVPPTWGLVLGEPCSRLPPAGGVGSASGQLAVWWWRSMVSECRQCDYSFGFGFGQQRRRGFLVCVTRSRYRFPSPCLGPAQEILCSLMELVHGVDGWAEVPDRAAGEPVEDGSECIEGKDEGAEGSEDDGLGEGGGRPRCPIALIDDIASGLTTPKVSYMSPRSLFIPRSWWPGSLGCV